MSALEKQPLRKKMFGAAKSKKPLQLQGLFFGADSRNRTGDLILTKEQSQNTAKEKHAYTSARSVCNELQYIV